jgi:hypothetical protein
MRTLKTSLSLLAAATVFGPFFAFSSLSCWMSLASDLLTRDRVLEGERG